MNLFARLVSFVAGGFIATLMVAFAQTASTYRAVGSQQLWKLRANSVRRQHFLPLPCLRSRKAYLAAGQGSAAAAEFQKILDHSGIVWNCWTGALARLGVARANALQAKTSQGVDAARVRALAAYKDFLALWKDADPNIPILKEAKAEYAKLQ